MQFLLFSGKIQVLELTPQATGQMPEGLWGARPCYRVCSKNSKDIFQVLCPSSSQQFRATWTPGPPPIFIPEGTEVQTHTIQLADFIPRDCSMERLQDLSEGVC